MQTVDDGLYPEIEPHRTGHLKREGHSLYFELSGDPTKPAALFLHGGPGGGTSPRVRRFFDPDKYNIVLLDQRGAGQSIPNVSADYDAALKDNTTPHLVADIEALRVELGLSSWALILGGSWGSTLALAYAQAHPQQVKALLLRGSSPSFPMRLIRCFRMVERPTITQMSGRPTSHTFGTPARIGPVSGITSLQRTETDFWTPSSAWPQRPLFVTYELSISPSAQE